MSFSINKTKRRQWSLKSLKFFEVCARHDTFAAAASELFVTHSAVSKQIKSLEEGLGFKLFTRDGNTLKLSSQGRVLADHLIGLFQGLDNLIDDLTESDASAPLVISCEPTICLKLLIPLLHDIEQATGVTLQVLSGGGAVNFRRDSVDLAIRRNDFLMDGDLHVYTLGKEYVGPVMCPDLAERFIVKNSTELDAISRIHSKTRPNAWQNWQTRTNHSLFSSDIFFEHHFSAIEAVDSAQGAAMMSIHMVSRLLAQNKLKAPFGFIEDGSDYVCLSLKPFEQDPRKKRICEWLRLLFDNNTEQALRINGAVADRL